jgi:hypothetical protein
MSVLRPFIEARAVLGVSAADDAAAIKRAYRRLAVAHPPDTDPDRFRRVRDAYELLTEPSTRVREMLLRPQPAVDPPPPPAVPPLPPAEVLAMVLLRLAAASVDTAAMLETATGPAETAPAAPPERKPLR